MALTSRIAADVIVKRNGQPASMMPSVEMMIPQALKETGRRIAADPATRALLVSDKASVQVAIGSNGKVNLVTAYGLSIIKEFIEHGQLYVLPSTTFTTGDVDANTDSIILRNDRVAVGDRVQFSTTSALPGGLSPSTDYWVRTYDSATGTITIAPTNALSSTVNITSQGAGTHTIIVQESNDFPLQRLPSPGMAPYDRYLGSIYRYYYIQGDTLQVLPQSTAGQVAFATPTYPATLSALPESLEAENIFLEVLNEIWTNSAKREV